MKKLTALALVLVLLCTLVPTALAQPGTFPDVTSPQYDWALDSIEAMVSIGYIKGFTDQTFKPANAISKKDSLILASRMVGFTAESNAEFVALADEMYGHLLEGYDFANKKEVAYLLYKGLLSESELDSYLDDANRNSPLPRYKAAELITKIVGGKAAGKKVEFDDAADIPKEAISYVAYAVDNGFMNGIGNNLFDPMGTVTRAQMAVILYRIVLAADFSVDNGAVTSVDYKNTTIVTTGAGGTSHTYPLSKTTPIMIDGKKASLDMVYPGYKAAVLFSGEDVTGAEFISVSVSTQFSATIAVVDTTTDPMKLTFKTDMGNVSYILSPYAEIVVDGEAADADALTAGLAAEVQIEDGQIFMLHAEQENLKLEGTITELEEDETGWLITVETDAGKTVSYYLAEDATVRRNTKRTTADALSVGDSVEATVAGRQITSLAAIGQTAVTEGTITAIHIAKEPYLIIKAKDGTEGTINLAAQYSIYIGKKLGGLYSLQLDDYVKLEMDGDKATKVTVTEETAPDEGVVTGVIKNINKKFAYITVTSADDTDYQVFITTSTKIAATGGIKLDANDLSEKDEVEINGKYTEDGAFEAATILVIY